jgi:hypothetical protein
LDQLLSINLRENAELYNIVVSASNGKVNGLAIAILE